MNKENTLKNHNDCGTFANVLIAGYKERESPTSVLVKRMSEQNVFSTARLKNAD